jgi:hypothetical protein
MAQTLKQRGNHRLSFTAGVNDRIAGDSEFSRFVMQSLDRFNRGDWGNVDGEDKASNDAELASLNNGGWYGRIMGSYQQASRMASIIWIIRNTAMEDGTQAVTVMFPSEY